MTRRALFGVLAAPLLPAAPITTESPDWVWVAIPGGPCAHCGEHPGGFEETIYCPECLTAKRVERVRHQPQVGDVVLGPGGSRVEVTKTLERGFGTLLYFTLTVPGKGSQERVIWDHHWAELDGWDVARLA